MDFNVFVFDVFCAYDRRLYHEIHLMLMPHHTKFIDIHESILKCCKKKWNIAENLKHTFFSHKKLTFKNMRAQKSKFLRNLTRLKFPLIQNKKLLRLIPRIQETIDLPFWTNIFNDFCQFEIIWSYSCGWRLEKIARPVLCGYSAWFLLSRHIWRAF